MLAERHGDDLGSHGLLALHELPDPLGVIRLEAEEGIVDVGDRGVDNGVVGLIGVVERDGRAVGPDLSQVLGRVPPYAAHDEVL